MAFNDTYRESIQSKHIANVGFTSTAKGVTNEAFALENPHQVIASQIPAVDVVGTYGALVADGINAGLVEKHTVKLTADPTVNNNLAWYATEDNCTETGHSARGSLRIGRWMRYAGTQYKLRLYEDTGANAPDYTAEILPSEVNFNWEYDASTGIVYFDEDPSSNGKTLPLWGELYTYVGNSVEDSLNTTTSGVGDLTELFNDTNEPSGFVDRTSSTLSFDDSSRNLTISGTSFSYYIEGQKYTKTGAESVQITDVEGMHYVYYDGSTLTHTATFSYDLIYNKAYVSAIYWDATNSTAIYVADERHGITMDGQTHAYLHTSFGTQFVSGLALSSVSIDGDGSSNAHAQFGTELGVIRDEDIVINIAADTSPTNIPIFYRNGAGGEWRYDTVTDYAVKTYSGGSSLLAYNQFTGGAWQQTEVASGSFVLAHIFATNDVANGIIAVQGQATYSTVSAARLGATDELSALVLNGLPFVEFTPVATIIFETNTSYTNTPKARIRSTDLGADYVDWRFAKLSPIESSVTYHSSLAGLTDAGAHPASSIYTDTTTFNAKLSSADDTVQKALATLDDHTHTESDITDLGNYSVVGHTHSESDITDLDKYTQSEVDSLVSSTSGTLQTQIDNLNLDFATDAELTTVSGYLQNQIDNLDSTYATDSELSTAVSDLTTIITTASGYLQNQIDSLDDTYATDAELALVSGSLQTQITNNYNTLDSKIDTTSGTLQSEIEAIESSLTDAIIWEVVDTPYDQIRPKAAHMGKAIYTSGNLTIGGDLTVSGTTTTINSQELTVEDKVITVNNGEVGAGITGSQYAGIEVDRGSETNYMFVFDEVQDNFRVGISGSLQAVATREDTPTDGYVAVWNASEYRFDTSISIALEDLATDAELTAASGTLQSAIDAVVSDLANNYYTITELDNGQLDNRYYTETEIDTLISTTSGTLQSQISANDIDILALDSKIDTTSGTLQSNINTVALDLASNYYTSTEVDGIVATTSGTLQDQIDGITLDFSNYYTSSQVDTLLSGKSDVGHSHDDLYYTETEIDLMFSGFTTTFIGLTDTMSSYSAGRVLFTTASGVVDDAALTFDSVSGTLSVTGIQLGTGDYVNEIVTTVTSGTTDQQIPTAKAVWDLTEAAAAAVHTHYDVDAVYVSDTSWTYGTGFAEVPADLVVYVNGMKNRLGAGNDYTVEVVGGVVTITFLYNVKSDFWVNITYTA